VNFAWLNWQPKNWGHKS